MHIWILLEFIQLSYFLSSDKPDVWMVWASTCIGENMVWVTPLWNGMLSTMLANIRFVRDLMKYKTLSISVHTPLWNGMLSTMLANIRFVRDLCYSSVSILPKLGTCIACQVFCKMINQYTTCKTWYMYCMPSILLSWLYSSKLFTKNGTRIASQVFYDHDFTVQNCSQKIV
jgi:hypothetical protein